ncbi:MAG: efflux RND transporter periplasmic adaptor subunit [Chloroflexota bacterium]
MTVKRIMFLLVIVVVGILLVAGIATAQEQTPPAANATALSPAAQDTGTRQLEATAEATQQATTTTSNGVSALGSVAANMVANLQFQTSGTVKGVYAEVGDYVKAGEVLADLKSDDAWTTYNQAQLNLESANLAMTTLMQPASEADLKVAKANVASAQAGYSDTANSITQTQLDTAQMKYDQAQAAATALEDERRHMDGTDAQITIKEAQIGAATFNAEIARLQLEALKTPNSSALWSSGVRIQQAQLQLEELQQGPAQSEIDSAQVGIERAQAAVLSAQTALQEIQLVAPITGYVTVVNISSDDSIAPGTAAIVISDTSSLHMTVPINELDIGKISEGMDTTISLDALPDLAIPGKVEHVGWLSTTSSDGIVTFDVQVVLNTTDPRVRIGMTGQVTIETGSTNS